MMDVVLGLAVALAAALQAPPAAPAEEKPKAGFVEPARQEARPPLPAAELKALRENNIFAPHKIERKAPKSHTPTVRTEKKILKPSPPVLTGIILDPATRAYQAVVEDRNKIDKLKLLKEPVFLKEGDEILVYRIESVVSGKVVVRSGESTKELKVGDSFPEAGLKGPDGVEITEEVTEPAPEANADAKSDAKTDAKPSESPSSASSSDEEKRRKTLEELRKKLGKKSRGNEN